MGIIVKGLIEGLTTRGLGASLEANTEIQSESTLNIENDLRVVKDTYPVTGTFAGVKGWQWSKSIPQDLRKENKRINSSIGGYEYNLEEGTVYKDWMGCVKNGLNNLDLKKIQINSKDEWWIPLIERGSYSIFHKEKTLMGDYSSSYIAKETYVEIDEESKDINVEVYKRDKYFNNISWIQYSYSETLEDNYSFFYENNYVYLNKLVNKSIGVDDNPIDGNWEFCGIGNSQRSILYTEYFPCSNVFLKEKRNDGSIIEWEKVEKFTFSNKREFIVDELNGKLLFNKRESVKKTVKEDLGFKIEFYEELDNLSNEGKINNNIQYLDKGKYQVFCSTNRESSFVKGEVVKFNLEALNFGEGSELYVKYEVFPKINVSYKESLRSEKKINLKPYSLKDSLSILKIKPYETQVNKLSLSCDKFKLSDSLYKTLYIQSDSTLVTAKAENYFSEPVEEIKIKFYCDNGLFEGDSKNITEISNSEGKAFTSYSQPYEESSLSQWVEINHVNGSTKVTLPNITPGIKKEDINLFQVLKTDPYYGSLGLKLEVESFYFDDENLIIKTVSEIKDAEEYITYQNFDLKEDNAIYYENTCQKGYINFGFGFLYGNQNTVSKKIIIKKIENKTIYIDRDFVESFFFEGISNIVIYKRNELEFDFVKSKQTGRSFDRICYYDNGSEYEVLKPSRIEGNNVWYDNIEIPKGSSSPTNLIAGYKMFLPKLNKVWAECIDPATGRIIRSDNLQIVIDYPTYLKGNSGFKFKDSFNEDESGLGGSNFITINPTITNQINFFI